jgi:Ceramidase
LLGDLSAPINLYCERLSADFWAEPVNATTNVAFLVAASVALRQWRRAGGHDYAALALIIVTVAVGLGSFAFHTMATRGAAVLDVVPIAVFIYGYFLLAMRRFVGLSAPIAIIWTIAFALAATIAPRWLPQGFLNGSGEYLPALVAQIGIGAWLIVRTGSGGLPADRAIAASLWTTGAVFALSLTFRSIDRAVCHTIPLGTHGLWHLLNAIVLYRLLGLAIEHGKARRVTLAPRT